MQFVSNWDNLHEISNYVFWEKKENTMLSAEFAQRVVMVKG